MRRWLWALGWMLAQLGAGAASATSCLPGTLGSYLALGAPGCELGGVVVGSFSLASGQTFATPLDPDTIQITPGGSSTAPTLELTLSANANAGSLLESFFRFGVSAPNLAGAGVTLLSASATGDGAITVIEDLCPDASFAGGEPSGCPNVAASLVAFQIDGDAGLADQATFAAQFLDVFVDLAVDGGLSGTASAGALRLSFDTVPEPSTWILLAAGAWLARRLSSGRR